MQKIFEHDNIRYGKGEVSEWFKVTTSKVVVGVTLPRVRIPPSPHGTDFGLYQSPFRFLLQNYFFVAVSFRTCIISVKSDLQYGFNLLKYRIPFSLHCLLE